MNYKSNYRFPDYDAFALSGKRNKSVAHTKGGSGLEFSSAISPLIMRVTWCIVVGFFLLILFWLTKLQVFEHTVYVSRALKNRTQTAVVAPPREMIFDRNGVVVAENTPEFQLWFDPALITSNEQRASLGSTIVSKIPNASRIPEGGLRSIQTPMMVAESVVYTHGLSFLSFAAEHDGFRITIRSKRLYPFGASLAHVVGYVGVVSPDELERIQKNDDVYRLDDEVGKEGVERFYEDLLKGIHGVRVVEKDVFGQALRVVQDDPAAQDHGFQLTIDAELQKVLYASLASSVETNRGSGGVIGIMDVTTGELYALVDYPSYDNNIFILRDNARIERVLSDPLFPLFNRGISGQYPSGSIIKPVIALAALNDGVVTERTTIQSVGGIHVGSFFFPDWKEEGHGSVDVYRAIAESVNTYFYYLGGGYGDFRGLGVTRIDSYARQFGLGGLTGIDLYGESQGFIPTPDWKERVKRDRWYIGDTYHLSIGQGDLLVTPIQMLQMVAGIAREGNLPQPRISKNKQIASKTIPIPDSYFQIIKKALRETVISGSARSLADLPVEVAGKTGTAEATRGNPHSWFVGFMPYQSPKFAFVVLVENGGEGSLAAVPLARTITLELLNRYRKEL